MGTPSGSSDAAAVLRGLTALWGLRTPPNTLHAWAAELGSDVPFFLQDRPARCRGRGERVTPATIPGARPVVLANAGFPVSTAWAYSALREANSSLTRRQALPTLSCDCWDSEGWEAGENDLESVVARKFPVLETLKASMLAFGASSASLSGSGGTVFGLCDHPRAAACVAERLQSAFGKQLWVRHTVTIS